MINFLELLRAAIFAAIFLSILYRPASPSNWQCIASKAEHILYYYQVSPLKIVEWVQPTFISSKTRRPFRKDVCANKTSISSFLLQFTHLNKIDGTKTCHV